ncbi:hypothetical protein [Spirobacillus cienkowskii]|uniref:hypothetical protein n=1 Tax=Spirobacillus cienkowskii TaxID=495820 RepID=UPI0030D6285D
MINIIFKKTNLLTASLLVISVVSCGKPYEYTPSNNSKYPVRYPANYNSKILKDLNEACDEIKSALNENIAVLNALITALKPNQGINRVNSNKNAQIVTATISELDLLKAKFEMMNNSNNIIRSQIPRSITPVGLSQSMLDNFIRQNSETNADNILETRNKLFEIFNDSSVNVLINSSEIFNIKEKIKKLSNIHSNTPSTKFVGNIDNQK